MTSKLEHTPSPVDLFSLKDKTAIITGGGGILGRTFGHALAAAGAKVALADLPEALQSPSIRELRDAFPDRIMLIDCDVTQPASVGALVNDVSRDFGDISILLNNAATKTSNVARFFEPFETYDLAIWNEVLSVNLTGMFLVAQAVGKHMLERKVRGSVIQTASIYGCVAPDSRIYEGSHYLGGAINTPAVYSASKAGVIGLSRHLAAHWAPAGIRVNTLSPGGVESGQNDVFRAKYSARVPLGRMGKDSELVGAILFLASDASSYVTGQNLVVDGGLTVW
jgi:NAD(P)-dependent dehydrogenase (short-subunit alcohol dehydrogenase family)